MKPKVGTRARIWCYTINNPKDEQESQLSHPKFLSNVKSSIHQLEEGENLTPHIQGVIQFKNQMTFDQVKKKLPLAHIEVCRNFIAAKLYCQKASGRLKLPVVYPAPREKLSDKEIALYWKKELIPGYVEKRPPKIED